MKNVKRRRVLAEMIINEAIDTKIDKPKATLKKFSNGLPATPRWEVFARLVPLSVEFVLNMISTVESKASLDNDMLQVERE